MKGKPLTADVFEELMRDAGAEGVSRDGLDEMDQVMNTYALYISRYAYEIARHAGRSTIEDDDIRLAAMNVNLGGGFLPGVQLPQLSKGEAGEPVQ